MRSEKESMEADTERLLLGKNGTSFHAFFHFLNFYNFYNFLGECTE